MSESIVARLPAPRKKRRWLAPVLALVLGPLVVGGVVYAAYPRHSNEADFRQIVDSILPEEEAAEAALRAEERKGGLDGAPDASDLAGSRERLATLKALDERDHARDMARLERARASMAALRLPATRKAIVMDQVEKDIDDATIHLDRSFAFRTEFVTTAEEMVDFLEKNRSSWSYSGGKFVFTDWYDMHGFGARAARLKWLARQAQDADAKALESRRAAVKTGYRWPPA